MKLFISFIFAIFLTSNYELKEKIIGNTESYNLKVISTIDPRKKTDEISFHHVITQKIYFRNKSNIIQTKTVNVEKLNGYALTEITELKAVDKKIYRMNYYRSNGSSEIFIFYDNNGSRLCKMNCPRNETKYIFIKKGFKASYFEDLEVIKNYDLDIL